MEKLDQFTLTFYFSSLFILGIIFILILVTLNAKKRTLLEVQKKELEFETILNKVQLKSVVSSPKKRTGYNSAKTRNFPSQMKKSRYTEGQIVKAHSEAYIERFNRRYREDVLDAYMFESLYHLRELSAEWQDEYKEFHPHQSFNNLSPNKYLETNT